LATKSQRAPRAFDRRIVEGDVAPAVWRLAWPAVLQNILGGMQGMVDHAMVGHLIGFVGNAAIGVAWQIFVVVIVFIMSVFTGMGVLVARASGAGDADQVTRTVYQAFIATAVLSLGVIAPLGYIFAPSLLDLVHATPEVRAEALPFLRIMLAFSLPMMMFFMSGSALRAAGDSRTPLRLGVLLTALNVAFNVVLIRGLGPIPAFGVAGAAIGTTLAATVVALLTAWMFFHGDMVIAFHRGMDWHGDWAIIRQLFRFGLPSGVQGVVMNIGGILMLRYIGSLPMSAEAQAAYTVSYTQLFSFVTWTSFGLMGAAAAAAGQNLGAHQPERSVQAVKAAWKMGLGMAGFLAILFVAIPRLLLDIFGMNDPVVVDIGVQLLRYLSVSALLVSTALTFTGGLQGTGDTKSPLYISIISQIAIPLGLCATFQAIRPLQPGDIWLAIVMGHLARASLSVVRFRQGKWRDIQVTFTPARVVPAAANDD
jgi:putative MATE family efflux protein